MADSANERITVHLGNGCVVHGPAGLAAVDVTAQPARSLSRGFSDDAFDFQLAAEGLTRRSVADVSVPAPRGFGETAPEPVQLDVEHAPDEAVLVQIEHEDGSISWLIPDPVGDGARGFDEAVSVSARFTIPVADLVPRVTPGSRALFGGIGKKLLKVFAFPIVAVKNKVTEVIGDVTAGFVRRWERNAKPYFTRDYTPETYRLAAGALESDEWQRLAEGRALLFVHGTFSSSDAFRSLEPEVMRELSRRYGGRLFAFNHPTLSDDPSQNAKTFLESIPPAVRAMDVDIVCHSRGGLVSREIANQGRDRGFAVKRIVFVGATNAGTTLASEKRILDLVNRYSTIAKLFPNTTTRTIVDAIVVVLKCAARALLHDLVGLKAMDPEGDYLKNINSVQVSAEELYGIAANFEPPTGSPLITITRLEDLAIDAVFSGAHNDLVVPTDGVCECSAPGFDIPMDRRFIFDASASVMHTHFFGIAETQERLQAWLEAPPGRELAFARGGDLTGDELQALRPHVVTLQGGRLSEGARVATSKTTVDEIFTKHIPAFAATLGAGAPLRIVFWAHGGLINERDGLAIAQKHIAWWKANRVYPVYFVWETGLFDALGGILAHAAGGSRQLAARGFSDITDGVVEGFARKLGGNAIWGEMKTNAARCSADKGGARYVAERLAAFVGTSSRPVELHAIGHSAGSIFHSHFLPVANGAGVPPFRTLQLLAPAIRTDEFKGRLQPLIGNSVSDLTVYSMHDERERADNCMAVYRKSLLYLIYHALEPRAKEPILGLEMCIDNDPALRSLFSSPAARTVWSVSSTSTGPNATSSTSHGGFDDDGPTMTSVAMRVLGAPAGGVKPYVGNARAGREWSLSPELNDVLLGAAGVAPAPNRPPRVSTMATVNSPAAPTATSAPSLPTGRRIALCIGIDRYPAPHTLGGCENDARAWGSLFREHLGFQDVSFLINTDATRDRITSEIRRLVGGAQPGDVVALQYAGHGTSLPDDDGDERDGTDEALVPIDFGDGQFLTDDDLRGLLGAVKPGVSLTVFMDCCNSGTITRVLGRTSAAASRGTARFIALADDSDPVKRHLSRRRDERGAGRGRAFVDRTTLRWVNFSACDATERAFEQNGSGAFTRITTALLRGAGAHMTNAELQRAIVDAFGVDRAQTPQLDCGPDAEAWPVMRLGSSAAGEAMADRRGALDRRAPGSPPRDELGRRGGPRREDELVTALREAADILERTT